MPDSRVGGDVPSGVVSGASWLDPALVALMSGVDPFDVDLAVGVKRQILTRNPERVAFIASRSAGMTAFPRIAPTADVGTFGLSGDAAISVRTFVLQDWLSLIIEDWWVQSAEVGTLRVWEFKAPTLPPRRVVTAKPPCSCKG